MVNVSNAVKHQALTVTVPGKMAGRICVTELFDRDDWVDQPLKKFKEGAVCKVACCVNLCG